MEIATATLFATVPNDLPVAVAGWQIIRFDDGACSASVDTGAGVMVPPFLTDGATVGQVIERARAGMDRPRVIARVAWVLSCGVSLGAPTRYPTEPQQSAVAVPAGAVWRCYTWPDCCQQSVEVVAGDGFERDATAFGAAMAFVDCVGGPAALWAIEQAEARALAQS